MSEQDLIDGCANGDRDAQRELYETHAARLFRLILRITRNADDAADVLQETFIHALTHVDGFAGRSSVATWLYRIAVNESLQQVRRRKRTAEKLAQIPVPSTDAGHETPTDLRVDLHGALSSLSEDDQAILLLRYQQGLDYNQIADALECAPGTVASRLNRARNRLRERLDGECK